MEYFVSFKKFHPGKEVAMTQKAKSKFIYLDGAGRDLGHRPMTQKLRLNHGLKVPERKVLRVMKVVDPEGVAARANVGDKRVLRRGNCNNSCVRY